MNIYISGFDMNGFKYILIVMGAAFISLLLVIFLITNFFIKNFDKISFYEYDILLKEKINLKNQGNDLVIIGDSSALNGIIPNQIIKTTKLKTYNLALYAHNGIESYKLLLKEYLKKNAPPKLVILYFSAQSPNNWDKTTYEKSILIFKYSDFKNKISYILKNPSSIIIITNRAIRATLRYKLFGSKKQKKFSKNLLIKLKDNKGFIESTANMSHNKCKFKYSNFKNESLIKNVKSFKSNFSKIKIKIYLAPILNCNEKKYEYLTFFESIIDNEVYYMNKKYFNDFSHLNIEGAIKNSNLFSQWLLREVN